jgi:hypothetical protein
VDLRDRAAGRRSGAYEALIDEEIARMAKDGPTPAELSKARNQALASFWRGLETIDGKAEALGRYEVLHGDYRKLFEAPKVYEGITAEDVRAVAANVLRRSNRTVGLLESPPRRSLRAVVRTTRGRHERVAAVGWGARHRSRCGGDVSSPRYRRPPPNPRRAASSCRPSSA